MPQHLGEHAGEVGGVAVRKRAPAAADRLLEAAPLRPHHHAAAGDPLERHDAERLGVARRHDENAVAVQERDELLAGPRPHQLDPGGEAQPLRLRAQRRSLRAVADDGQARREPAVFRGGERGERIEQHVHPLVRDQAADEGELAVPRRRRQQAEEVVTIGVEARVEGQT